MKTYVPSKKILEKYADVMVNYALNSGKGLKKGEVVMLDGNDSCKPLYLEVYKKIIQKGGHVIENYSLDDKDFSPKKYFYSHATKAQSQYFPEKYYQGLIDTIDHRIYLHAENDLNLLKKADPKIMMRHKEAMKPWTKLRFDKEIKGDFTWTIANYGTQSMADAAGMTLKEYWAQIIKACYLRDENPVATWKQLQKDIQKNVTKLDKLNIRELHMTGEDMDLKLRLPYKGAWKGGSGANIPSFEIFTSPDWRGTQGWIRFNQPLYYYGNVITDIYLEFKNGKVVASSASKNEKLLKEMIATKDADKSGEFSLTDARHSKITKPMADTLYDENMGGKYGNTHIALGMSYRDCYKGDPSTVSEEEWLDMGYNFSSVHTDIISTTDRTVTATLADGSEKVIYKKGQFVL